MPENCLNFSRTRHDQDPLPHVGRSAIDFSQRQSSALLLVCLVSIIPGVPQYIGFCCVLLIFAWKIASTGNALLSTTSRAPIDLRIIIAIAFIVHLLHLMIFYPWNTLGLYHTLLTISGCFFVLISNRMIASKRSLCLFATTLVLSQVAYNNFEFLPSVFKGSYTSGYEGEIETALDFLIVALITRLMAKDLAPKLIVVLILLCVSFAAKRTATLCLFCCASAWLSIAILNKFKTPDWAKCTLAISVYSTAFVLLVFYTPYTIDLFRHFGVNSYGREMIWAYNSDFHDIGIGRSLDASLSFRDKIPLAHCEFLRLAMDWGRLFSYAFIVSIIIAHWRHDRDRALVFWIGLLPTMAFDNPLVYFATFMLPSAIIAFCATPKNQNMQKSLGEKT